MYTFTYPCDSELNNRLLLMNKSIFPYILLKYIILVIKSIIISIVPLNGNGVIIETFLSHSLR